MYVCMCVDFNRLCEFYGFLVVLPIISSIWCMIKTVDIKRLRCVLRVVTVIIRPLTVTVQKQPFYILFERIAFPILRLTV